MERDVENAVVTLHRLGRSQRNIAHVVGVSRNTVRSIVERIRSERDEGHSALPALPKRRSSQLDDHRDRIDALLTEFPDISAVRMYEELCSHGFEGGYTIVKTLMRRIRPKAKVAPSQRIETDPGQQGQQDWSPYTIDFTVSGRLVVKCFSLVLSFSRRQYIHFGEREDFYTLIRQHVAAFEHFDGVPKQILFDRQKAVVLGYENGRNLYNPRFLAFATHYGFRPHALPPRKPEWKGKVERPFQYVEGNCLNARKFTTLDHLNEHAAWWMGNVSDPHKHRRTGEPPIERFGREADHLLHLPRHPYDTAQVGYRVVDRDRLVSWDGTPYSVPPEYVLDLVVVRATADEIIVYGHELDVIARHERAPRGHIEPVSNPDHFPKKRVRGEDIDTLVARMTALGDAGAAFAVGVCKNKRLRGMHLARVLAHQERYAVHDIVAALERAVRYRAFSEHTVTRILEATASPRLLPDTLADAAMERLRRELAHTDVPPRAMSAYARAIRGED
ncbi:MAG: IS21 family transposase [bacterium]|nr:IS21 family transposase [bacterium]